MEFNAKFVHFMWSDELEGKSVFFADYISNLKDRVENNDIEYLDKVTQGKPNMPFKMVNDEGYWQFAYFDPYYEFKRALEQGKEIEVDFFNNGKWTVISNPTWDNEPSKYRIKEVKPAENNVTNRELAKWLVQGNGECCILNGGVSTVWTYRRDKENEFVDSLAVNIRKWDSDEWLPLTKENLLVSYGM